MKTKRILVTGYAGCIGSSFVAYFLEKYKNYFIVNLDSLTCTGDLESEVSLEASLSKRV